ncbi:uncharacterized protein CMU_035500 [Cryptosporidium muris RN66]|uniref:Uncharacterized protein n=1 Tax=Cryptosporidium muris (strain RN66) TaxID=441375 RepID=B6AGN7_CRYMR|nr:uncharacterized protein CMU_035500 [Cryptosporidium muris RN66]EEA07378.1 hypothetical protein, conserved [Cryptosporidium muris RN66]|eukprot:XP_002141727.1 hypothetical protein [Cryptosporidium muris RN66]
MTNISSYTEKIGKVNNSIINTFIDESNFEESQYTGNTVQKSELNGKLDASNAQESFTVLSALDDPAELPIEIEGVCGVTKQLNVLGLLSNNTNSEEVTKRSVKNFSLPNIGLDTVIKLGDKSYEYSGGEEWKPMSPSLRWQRSMASENATITSSSLPIQRGKMNSPNIIRELENELEKTKGTIILNSTGEKFYDYNSGKYREAKAVWTDEPLKPILCKAQTDKKSNKYQNPEMTRSITNNSKDSISNIIYSNMDVPEAKMTTMEKFGNIKVPIRSTSSMMTFAAERAKNSQSEKDSKIELDILNMIDPMQDKILDKTLLNNKSAMSTMESIPENIPIESSKFNNNNEILYKPYINEELRKKILGKKLKSGDMKMQGALDKKEIKQIKTKFEKKYGVTLNNEIDLEVISESLISTEKFKKHINVTKQLETLKTSIGWFDCQDKENEDFQCIRNDASEKRSKEKESLINRIIDNTTSYPCFDEVLFQNSFRVQDPSRCNKVTQITLAQDATTVPDSTEMLLGIHKKQYTPPISDKLPTGLPAHIQDPRIVWKQEFQSIPYDSIANLVSKIDHGTWDEIENDLVINSFTSMGLKSYLTFKSHSSINLREFAYNSLYSLEAPINVSPSPLPPLASPNGRCKLDTNTTKPSTNPSTNPSINPSTAIKSNYLTPSSAFQLPTTGKSRIDVTTINYIPEYEAFEMKLWKNYNYPLHVANTGKIKKYKLGKFDKFKPITMNQLVGMADIWQKEIDAQTTEQKKGLKLLEGTHEESASADTYIEKLTSVVLDEYSKLDKKDINNLFDVLVSNNVPTIPKSSVAPKTKYDEFGYRKMGMVPGRSALYSFKDMNYPGRRIMREDLSFGRRKRQVKVGGLKDEKGAISPTLQNKRNVTPDKHTNKNALNVDLDEYATDEESSLSQSILHKIKKPHLLTHKGLDRDEFEQIDQESELYEDDISVLDEYYDEEDEYISDLDESVDYHTICRSIDVTEWEPTNLILTRVLFKSMKSIYVTLATVFFRNFKSKYRIEIYELGEHTIIVWIDRDRIKFKERLLSCFTLKQDKLKVKGGIYFTPDAEISPIEPCADIPGNFVFQVSGVSLAHILLKNEPKKKLEMIEDFTSQVNLRKEVSFYDSEDSNSIKEDVKQEVDKKKSIHGGLEINTENDKIAEGINIQSFVPAMNSNEITGNNTIAILTTDIKLQGLMPIALKGEPKITVRFSLRRDRLVLWRSVRCQIWRCQYIDLCYKYNLVPAKKVVSYITNAFSRVRHGAPLDMSGIPYQYEIFSHCLNIALVHQEPKEISFRGCYMNDEGLSQIFILLKQFKSIFKLDFGINDLTIKSAPLVLEIVRNSKCKKLLLDFNHFGPSKTKRDFAQFLRHLLFSCEIKVLDFSRNRINGRCIDFFDTIIGSLPFRNKTLEKLIWCSNDNTQPEIETLVLALQPICISLNMVVVGGNPIERVDAIKRRFKPIQMSMEDLTVAYLKTEERESLDHD